MSLIQTRLADISPIAPRLAGLSIVLIEWAWRAPGLIIHFEPHNIRGLAGLPDGAVRLVERQKSASRIVSSSASLRQQRLEPAALHFIAPPVQSKVKIALAIRNSKANLLWHYGR